MGTVPMTTRSTRRAQLRTGARACPRPLFLTPSTRRIQAAELPTGRRWALATHQTRGPRKAQAAPALVLNTDDVASMDALHPPRSMVAPPWPESADMPSVYRTRSKTGEARSARPLLTLLPALRGRRTGKPAPMLRRSPIGRLDGYTVRLHTGRGPLHRFDPSSCLHLPLPNQAPSDRVAPPLPTAHGPTLTRRTPHSAPVQYPLMMRCCVQCPRLWHRDC